jgi:hypothetical protein
MAHDSYMNDILGNVYCRDCGTEWPCLPVRQAWEAEQDRAVRCKCSHIAEVHELGTGFCSSVACGCRSLRPKDVAA